MTAAINAGMNVASGLHHRLADEPALAEAHGVALFDIRHMRPTLSVGSGKKRSGKRVLTVGTDCSVGKMYTSLALEAAMREHGMKADFRATGQTGILVAGAGIAINAVVADSIAGAAEALSPAAPSAAPADGRPGRLRRS
nr:EBNA-1 nuclear protein [Candidatus Pantoea persica]